MSGLIVSVSIKSPQKDRLEPDHLLSTLKTPFTSRPKLGQLIITTIYTVLSGRDLIKRQKPLVIRIQLVGTLMN